MSTDLMLKGKVTPRSLPFLSSPIASKHSAFPLTEVSTSKGWLSRRNSSWKRQLRSQAMFMWGHSVWIEIGRRRNTCKKQLNLHPSQGQQSVFFRSNYPLCYLQSYCFSFKIMFGSKYYGSNGGSNVKFLGFFGVKFHKENLQLRG